MQTCTVLPIGITVRVCIVQLGDPSMTSTEKSNESVPIDDPMVFERRMSIRFDSSFPLSLCFVSELQLEMQIYRSVTYMSSIAIANRMKIFNQQKAFEKTLELFESNKNNPSVPLSSAMISQALKACTHTRDFQRGIEIHRFVSSRVKDNPYITASLVHLYSE